MVRCRVQWLGSAVVCTVRGHLMAAPGAIDRLDYGTLSLFFRFDGVDSTDLVVWNREHRSPHRVRLVRVDRGQPAGPPVAADWELQCPFLEMGDELKGRPRCYFGHLEPSMRAV